MDANDLNQQLRNLYLHRLPEIYSAIRENTDELQLLKMHGPFMMHVHPEYITAPKKLMLVGREARNERLIDINETPQDAYYQATDFYKNFTGGLSYDHTPFWKFIKELNQSYGITDYRKSSLWTNLSKINVNGHRPEGDLLNMTMANFLDVLIEEITIVKPDIVIILTKDLKYHWFLQNRFRAETVGTSNKNLSKLLIDALPNEKIFCMPHPRALCRRPGFNNNIAAIIQELNRQMV